MDHPPPALIISFLLSTFALVAAAFSLFISVRAYQKVRLYRFHEIELGVIERTGSPPPDGMLADTYYRGDMSEYVFEKLCLGYYQKEIGK